MEYGLIKDTTLQSMAEGLREKGFVDATRIEDVLRESVHYATENVTSDTDATPAYNANSNLPTVSTLGYSPIITEMPGASSIEFIVDIGLVHPDATTTQCGRFEIYGREGTPIVSETINRDYKGKHTYIIPGDYVRYGRNSSYVTVRDCYTAFIVDLYPLDADGNRTTFLNPEEVVNTISPEAMAEAINNAPVPVPEESFVLEGILDRLNWGGHWDWFFNLYGDKISTKDITSMNYSFSEANTITRFPFVFNLKNANGLNNTFNAMAHLEECPKLRGTLAATTSLDFDNLTGGCLRLRDLNDLFEPEMLDVFSTIKCTSSFSCAKVISFFNCASLRSVPEWFYKFRLCEESTAYPYSSYILYYDPFQGCTNLDEALNIPVWKCKVAQTSNMFNSTVSGCYRLKNFTFETDENGQPIQTDWKSQVLNFTAVGFAPSSNAVNLYNSGITKDKKVDSDETYQALKNDPDWYTEGNAVERWSRYDHDSAVRTINSLPDTSAYLASAGGTNTIKFKGTAGSNTDAGAINTLTAEEIAVAAAKGWTVTLS